MSNMSKYKYNVSEDNVDLEKAVLAAKFGNWTVALSTIREKPYLVNCIPENRSWSVLHQAVYWKDEGVVRQLLDLGSCDALVRTKQSCNNDARPSSTPREVAEQLGGRANLITLLDLHVKNVRAKRFGGNVTYVVSRQDGEKVLDHLPLFMKAVIMYKDSLLGPGTCPKDHLLNLLKQVLEEEDHQWGVVREKLHQSMYGIDRSCADELSNAESESQLFQQIIKFYTGNYHPTINNAVSRDFSNKVKPTAEDMAIALYDLLLDAIVMCWGTLTGRAGTTYRGVGVKVDVEKGKEIIFTHFLSSSLSEQVARGFAGCSGTLFIIDNSASSSYRPRHIENWSLFQGEKECLYGIGAEFRVTNVDNSESLRKVYLQLI